MKKNNIYGSSTPVSNAQSLNNEANGSQNNVANNTDEKPKEILPSLFASLRATCSKPLQRMKDLEYFIGYDKATKINTMNYRKIVLIDRKLAANHKRNSIAICPSIQFQPKGRTLEDFSQETLVGMLDYDKVVSAILNEKVSIASKSKYAMTVYRTISGMGFRILFRYTRPEGCTLTATELHRLAIDKAINYFNDLLTLAADTQCRDMTRLCGLAYDPKAYFNWDAAPMEITPQEVTRFYNTVVKAEVENMNAQESGKSAIASKRCQGAKSHKTADTSQPSTTEEITNEVKRMSENWDIHFEEGSHNKFLMRFTAFCHNYGADRDELLDWLLATYGNEYQGIKDIVKTIYKHVDSFGCWHLLNKSEGWGKQHSVKAIRQWLGNKYELRHNTLTGKNELRSIDISNGKYFKWEEIDDTIENSLYCDMEIDGLWVSQKKLHSVINSDYNNDFNPLWEYLRSLNTTWQEDKDPDYIAELAHMVKVKTYEGFYHDEDYFVYAFKKWFVAMVASWCTDSVVNHTILILVGKGGIFKTTFLEKLLPPELHKYFANDSTADYSNKDFQEMEASKALVCLDEYDSPKGKNLNAFKSLITKLEVVQRRPYDRYASILKHNTSFCATSNKIHFLTEEENRRYLIWEVESIDNPHQHKIDYTHVYAQALALAKGVMEKRQKGTLDENDGDWIYWLNAQDRIKQEIHNRLFMTNNYLEEMILKYYRKPEEKDLHNINLKFVTSAGIIEHICTNSVFRQEFGNKDIVQAMNRLGFVRKHRRFGDGWWVVEKDGRDIQNDAEFIIGTDEL